MTDDNEEISVPENNVKTATELQSDDTSPENDSVAPDEEKGSEAYSELSEKDSGEPDLNETGENTELQTKDTDTAPAAEKSDVQDGEIAESEIRNKLPPDKQLDPDDPDGRRKISFGQDVGPPIGTTDPEVTIRRLRAANQRLRRELAGFTKTLDEKLAETNPITPRKSRPSMQHDDIEVVRFQLENKEKALANLQKSYNRMEQILNSSESAENLLKMNNKVSELKIEIRQMKEENRTLMMVTRRTEKSYTTLESDQKGFPEKIESLEKEIRACRESLKKSNLENTEKDRLLRKIHDKMSTLDSKCRRLQDELDGKSPPRKSKSIEKLTTERDEAVEKLVDVEERLSEQRNRFVAQIQKANKTIKGLENELSEMTREIQRLESLPRPAAPLHHPKAPKPRIAGTPSREKKLRQRQSSSKPPAGTRLPPVRAKKIIPKSSGYGAAAKPKKKRLAKRVSKGPGGKRASKDSEDSQPSERPAEQKHDQDENSVEVANSADVQQEPAEPEADETTEDTTVDSENLEPVGENPPEKDENLVEKGENPPENDENPIEKDESVAEKEENSPEAEKDPPESGENLPEKDENLVTDDGEQAEADQENDEDG